jgi:thiol-disulfide isomerase/thioredoxin
MTPRGTLIHTVLFCAACTVGSVPVASAAGISGLWDAIVVANQVDVPFRFEIAQTGSHADGWFFEGDRRVASTSGSFDNGVMKLEFDFLNTILEATFDGDQLRGTYRNKRAGARPMEFRARRYVRVPVETAPVRKIDGSWTMYRIGKDNSKLDVSWRLYLRQSGAEVSGAILKTSGDTGTLTGRWRGRQLVMSHFAGERPLLFEATPNADGTLTVTLDRQFSYRAARTAEARAKDIPEPPDLSQFTAVKDPTERLHFSGRTPDGELISDADRRFAGKVVIVTVGGSWCPNCHDEAPFLVDLYREFRSQGLEIVGLFFETDADLAAVRPRIAAFVKRYQVTFPIVVPGTTDEAAAKLPQLVNLAVFPTTVVLGRDGRVRHVHAGFASAATGEEHVRLTREQRELIRRLLREAPPKPGQSR